MKLTASGFSFSINEGADELTYIWPWKRSFRHQVFRSRRFGVASSFSSLKDYWRELGRVDGILFNNTKVEGFSKGVVIQEWARFRFNTGYYLLLHNICPLEKPREFWSSLPPKKSLVFTKDIIVFRCKDLWEAQTLLKSIETSFADAYLLENGEVILSNED